MKKMNGIIKHTLPGHAYRKNGIYTCGLMCGKIDEELNARRLAKGIEKCVCVWGVYRERKKERKKERREKERERKRERGGDRKRNVFSARD